MEHASRSVSTLAQVIRRQVIERSYHAHMGHIGSALSIADLVAAVYGGILRADDPEHPGRDRFILSKGHAVLALYAALHARGLISEEELDSYCTDGTLLGAHPEHALPGIDFSTGSLGQGLSVAVGAALAARMQGSPRRTIVLLSDAECNEGSVWEAAMFAAHHELASLIAVVDVNGQQALGYTRDVIRLDPLASRWEAFGWDVHVQDGHDPEVLVEVVDGLGTGQGKPHVVLAQTTFGKGVSFMENEIAWHYWPLSAAQFEQAIGEIEGAVR